MGTNRLEAFSDGVIAVINETNIDAETRAEPRFNERAADLKPVGARLQGPSR